MWRLVRAQHSSTIRCVTELGATGLPVAIQSMHGGRHGRMEKGHQGEQTSLLPDVQSVEPTRTAGPRHLLAGVHESIFLVILK